MVYFDSPLLRGTRKDPLQKLERHHCTLAGTAGVTDIGAPKAAPSSASAPRFKLSDLRSKGRSRRIPKRLNALSHLFGGQRLGEDICCLIVRVYVFNADVFIF